eukprot:gene15636-biopygen23208
MGLGIVGGPAPRETAEIADIFLVMGVCWSGGGVCPPCGGWRQAREAGRPAEHVRGMCLTQGCPPEVLRKSHGVGKTGVRLAKYDLSLPRFSVSGEVIFEGRGAARAQGRGLQGEQCSGAGVARAWRGRGARMACSPRGQVGAGCAVLTVRFQFLKRFPGILNQ